jgi:hypothetical protein
MKNLTDSSPLDDNFLQWIVIDWGGKGEASWAKDTETTDRFLLLTPGGGRNWSHEAPVRSDNISQAFVLVMFLDAEKRFLKPGEFDVLNLFGGRKEGMPIWCHYGGDLNHDRDLSSEWPRFSQGFKVLDETYIDDFTEVLPPVAKFPMPYTKSDKNLNVHWEYIRKLSRSSDTWDKFIKSLNETWIRMLFKYSKISDRVVMQRLTDIPVCCRRLILRLNKIEQMQEADIEQAVLEVLRQVHIGDILKNALEAVQSTDLPIVDKLDIVYTIIIDMQDPGWHSTGSKYMTKLREGLEALILSFDESQGRLHHSSGNE